MAHTAALSSQIVFIDTRLADYQTLVDQIGYKDVVIVLINADEDGFARMATHLAGHSDVQAIHVLGHGSSGQAQLGTATLNNSTLSQYAQHLRQIGQSLTADGDILFYGCELASGEAGENFVAQLASYTQADIAASNNITGAAQAGGDWNLEYQTGLVEAAPYSLDNYAYTLGAVTFTIKVGAISNSYTFTNAANGQSYASGAVGWLNTNGTDGAVTITVSGSGSVWSAISWDVVLDNDSDNTTPTVTSQGGPGFTEISGSGASGSSGTLAVDSDTDIAIRITSFTAYVAPNNAPVATFTSFSTNEDTAKSGTLTATDADGDTLSYTRTANTSNGTLNVASNGGYTYTPNANFSGSDSFTYQVSDGNGGTDSQTVAITVTSVNDPLTWSSGTPTNQSWASPGTNNYSFSAGATDVDGGVGYSIVSGVPGWMSGSVSGSNFSFSGNPSTSVANQSYSITVRANSNGGDSQDRTFSIGIGNASQVNDTPTSSGSSRTGTEDAAITFASSNFQFSDLDSGNALSSIKIISLPTNGTLTLSASNVAANDVILVASIGNLTFTPTANFNGSSSFQYQVSDGIAYSSNATMSITVSAVNDAPVLTGTGSDMTGIDENATTDGLNAGQLVSAVLATISDVDTTIGSTTNGSTNGLLQGVAVYSTTVGGPSTGGKWQYKVGAGSWTDVGTVSGTSALLLKSTDLIRFLPDGKNGQTASFDYYAWDQATGSAGNKVSVATRGDATPFSSASDSVAITVGDVNDAPTIAKPSAQTVSEDASIGITGVSFGDVDIVDRNDSDSTNNGMIATLSVTSGTLTLAGTTGITVDAGANGSATLTISGTRDAINTAVATLTYAPNTNYSGADSLSIGINDKGNVGTGGVLTAADTVGITVTPVNDAPVLVDGVPRLTTIDENSTTVTTAGNLVSDLLAGTVGGSTAGAKTGRTDVDTLNNSGLGNVPEAVGQGIAIHATSNTGPADGGTWQYSINNGTSWTDIGTVSSSSALLLAATDKVRFVPDAENATSASISFYAWDQATGARGNKVDPGARGGSTAFSLLSDTATVSVTPVNDAPVLDLDADDSSTATGSAFKVTYLPRGSEVAVVDADVTIRDVDQTANPSTAAVHAGQDTISRAVVSLATGAADNYPGQTDETLTFKDAGVATTVWNGLTISGNGSTVVTITGAATWAVYQSALQKVSYNNANLNPTTGDRSITVVVTDNDDTDAAGNHTNKLASNTATTTLNVASIAVVDMNGNLTGANHTVTYTEGDAGRMLAATDGRIDNLGGNNIRTVVLTLSNALDGTTGNAESLFVDAAIITSLASTRGITVTGSGTHTVTLSATNAGTGVTANNINVALRAVQYANTSDVPSVTPRVVNVSVADLTMAGVGATSTINVVPVNDAPVISANAAHTVLEGGLLTLSSTNLNATDIDDTQSTLDFMVTTAPTKGVLFRDGNGNGVAESGEVLAAVPGTGVITSFTQGDLVAGRVKYQQTDTALLSVTDYGSDSFAFKVQDGMENGVVAPTGTHTLNITAVNDAPTLTATASNPTFSEAASTAVALFSASAASAIESAQTLTEIKLTVAGLVNGADEKLVASGGTAFALQTTVTTPVVGSTVAGVSYAVTISGSTATITLTHAGLTPLQAQTLVDSLQYQNTSNAPSGSTRVVTLISVKDSGGTVESGSIDTTVLSLASTVAIIANDSTPVLATNTGKNVANGALITLTTTELNTTDSDTPSSAIQYTVGTAPTKGTLFKDLNGSGAAEAGETLTATSTFTQADLAAGLIKYRHNGVDDTADSFAFTVKDASTTLASATFALTVTAVTPTSPTVSGTGATTPNSTDGSDVLFTGVVISPPAGETVKSLQFTLVGVRDGNKEFVTINGQAVPMVAGTTTVGNETYVVVANGNGSFTVTVTDITNPGWSGPDASAIVNGARYKNTEVPPTAGVRTATLDSVTDYLADGSTGTPTTVAITSTITLATSTNLWTLPQAEAAVLAPNNFITTLNFTVTGALNGANEFIKINGREVALTPGTTTLNGVTYVVAESPASSGNFTLAITNPAGWTEVQSETLLDDATYSNNANPATAGNRVVTLVSVVEAVSPTLPNVGNPTPNPTLTLVDPNLVATVPTAGGVTVTNTEPTVVTNTTVAVAEGQTVTLTSTHVAATDAQQAAGSLVFKLVSAPTNGTLFRDGNGNGLVETGEAMAANATFTQLELTSGSIKYRHDSSETATDELSFTVSDGIATTTAMSLAFAVSHVNDQPTLSATGASPTYTEATTPVPVALYSAAAAATGDTLGATQKFTTLTLTVSNIADGASEMLLVNGSAAGNRIELSGATASGSVGQVNGTGLNYAVSKSGNTATVTLTHAGLSAAELQTLVNGLAYQNTSTNPTAGARAVNITQLKDDGGGTLPDLDTAFLSLGSTVTVAATNNAPTLTVVANGTNPAGFTIVEGGAQTLTATHLAAADTDTASSNFVYKLTTVPSASGLLYLDNNGNAINDTGDTTVALNSTFTQAELTGGKVRFQHAGGEATTETMAFSVSDGNSSSSSATLTVTLTPVNDAPTLGSLDGDTITYPPLNPAMLIDLGSNATVTDPDSTNFDTGTLRASVYFNGDAVHDVLSIKNVGTSTGQISVASNTVSYAGSAIGTYTGGNSGADLVVTLNASANPAAIAALIRALQFNNTQAAPVNNSRGIRISVSDGDGGTSLASQVQINIPVGGPAFLSGSGFYVSENTTLVTVMSASDVVGKMPITYSISPNSTANNTDAAKFSIDATSGTLSFLAAPDFEIPTDSGTNNVYNVIVRASNNESAYTEAALAVNVVNIANESTGATSGDTAGPVFGFATVNASTLVITYTDASHLDAANVPLATAFTVSGNTVTSVAVNATAKTVTLTLGAAVVAGAAVTLTYTDPTGNNDMLAIQDAAGNDAASLASINVSNITPSTNAGAGGGGGGGGGGGITTPVTPDSSKPNNSVTTDEKGNINVTNNDLTVTTINNPKSGTVVTNSGGGNVNLTEPGSILAINNEGTGTITTSGVQNQTSLFINGSGFQVIDLSGLKAGESVTINHTGSGEVDIKNLPDGVIINLTGNGKFLFNDADGSDNNIENLIPSLFSEKPGDGNGDGTSDALQSNVVSFQFLNTPTPLTNPDNALLVFLTLVVDSKGGKIDHLDDNTATLKNIKQLDAPLSLPAGAQMPLGLVSFSADIGIANDGKAITESFSIYADPSLDINGYWKQDSLGSWINLASSVNGGGMFLEGDKMRLDFVITDGGAFDADKSINGIIVDPGGVGFIPMTMIGFSQNDWQSIIGFAPNIPIEFFIF